MSVTALDFDWIAIDGDGAEHQLRDHYRAFNFDFGANRSRLTPPRAFMSSGALILNNQTDYFDYDLLEAYKSLIVRTSGYTYLNLEVVDHELREEDSSAILHLAGRLSAKRADGVEYTNRPDQLMSSPTDEQRIAEYFPHAELGELYGLSLPGSFEIAGSVPTPVIEFDTQSLIAAFEGSCSVVFLERCETEHPAVLVTQMPIVSTNEADHTFRPDTTVVRKGYREGRTRHWQANRWDVLLASSAWSQLTTTGGGPNDNSPISIRVESQPNSSHSFLHWTWLNNRYPELFADNLDPSEWGGFVNNQVASNSTWSSSQADRDDGAPQEVTRIFVVDPSVVTLEWARVVGTQYDVTLTIQPGLLQYYKTANVRERRQLFMTDVETDSERIIHTNRFPLLDRGKSDNHQLINSVLDAWARWDAIWFDAALMPHSLDEGEPRSIAQKRPGDVINWRGGRIHHRAMITRVSWQMTGITPLVVSWQLVTVDRAGAFLPFAIGRRNFVVADREMGVRV